jgi:hypothetical protein
MDDDALKRTEQLSCLLLAPMETLGQNQPLRMIGGRQRESGNRTACLLG